MCALSIQKYFSLSFSQITSLFSDSWIIGTYLSSPSSYSFTHLDGKKKITIWSPNYRRGDDAYSEFRYVDQKNDEPLKLCIFGSIKNEESVIYDNVYISYIWTDEELRTIQNVLIPELLSKMIWYIYQDDTKPFYENSFLSEWFRNNIKNEYELYLEQRQQLKSIMYDLYILVDVVNIMIEYM